MKPIISHKEAYVKLMKIKELLNEAFAEARIVSDGVDDKDNSCPEYVRKKARKLGDIILKATQTIKIELV